MEPELILDEASLHGNSYAYVEDDGRVVFLYLRFEAEIERRLRVVWVRNRGGAPSAMRRDEMARGLLPMMPAKFCAHTSGQPALDRSALRLVWLPEGDGVALYERDEMIAAIVPWSGMSGFDGYARDALGQGPLAWELSQDNVLHGRFSEAKEYWTRWESGESSWSRVQQAQLDCYEEHFDKHSRYYAIDQGQWPPKALVRIEWGDPILLLTIGMCIRPQPAVEMFAEDPTPLRRVELGAILPASSDEETIRNASHALSSLASYPWHNVTWFGHGHSIEADLLSDGKHIAVLLADSSMWGPSLRLPDVDGDPVKLLWVIPITAEELELKSSHGASAVLTGKS